MFRRLNHCACPGYSPLCVDSNDPKTVQSGFCARLLRTVPTPDPVVLSRFERFVKRFVSNLPKIPYKPSFYDWIANCPYTIERKTQLTTIYEELLGAPPSRRRASHVDSFVKSEFYPTWKYARLINSRSDEFKAWSGPYFSAIEAIVYQLPEFIKHVPVPERPACIASMRQANGQYYSTDFTAFESHFTPELLRICECQLYEHCIDDPEVSGYINSVLMGPNRMRTRSGIKATCNGGRMSGDMCTSLGNGFTNLMLAKFLAEEEGGHVTGFVEGDDGLFCTDFELTAEMYEHLGFTIKIEKIPDPTVASFCGMVFSGSGEIIREPRRFLMGFGWTQSFISAGPTIMDELLRAKALSTIYETPQCPIIGAMARYALSKTRHVRPRFVNDGYHVAPDEFSLPNYAPSSDTRELFEHLYGISIGLQLQVEAAIGRGDFDLVSSLIPPTVEQLAYTNLYVVVA